MELFLLISLNEQCEGVTASTIRLVREHLYLVDDDYRSNETVNHLFMQLMSAPNGMTHQMRRMNSYGFLAAYIPAFARRSRAVCNTICFTPIRSTSTLFS